MLLHQMDSHVNHSLPSCKDEIEESDESGKK